MKIKVAELEAKNDLLVEVLVRHTGKSEEEVRAAMERDNYMDPARAVEFGLADRVLEPGAGLPGEDPKESDDKFSEKEVALSNEFVKLSLDIDD